MTCRSFGKPKGSLLFAAWASSMQAPNSARKKQTWPSNLHYANCSSSCRGCLPCTACQAHPLSRRTASCCHLPMPHCQQCPAGCRQPLKIYSNSKLHAETKACLLHSNRPENVSFSSSLRCAKFACSFCYCACSWEFTKWTSDTAADF